MTQGTTICITCFLFYREYNFLVSSSFTHSSLNSAKEIRFPVLTVVTEDCCVLDVMPCTLVGHYQPVRGACRLEEFHSRNIGNDLPDYTVAHTNRQLSFLKIYLIFLHLSVWTVDTRCSWCMSRTYFIASG